MAKNSSKISGISKPICPNCQSGQVIRRGVRKKKLETVQIYECKNCARKFSLGSGRHKTYPLRVILTALSLYNQLHSKDEIVEAVKKKYRLKISPENITRWLKDYGDHLPFLRMREFVGPKYRRQEIIVRSRMFHGQIYDFGYHRAKMDLILNEEFRHFRFHSLQEFLELVVAECPHQIFKDNPRRASEHKGIFNLDSVKISRKFNAACQAAGLIKEAQGNPKLRHGSLQEFMLCNDSVTVGTEVPVLLGSDDLFHYQKMLGFTVPLELDEGEAITGHIDIVQIRNGAVHLLDYKPSARKEKPIAQLVLYALALSRLTGLRLYHFKCAWFDEEDYFEFYPLHVVWKKRKKKTKLRQ